MTLEEETHIDVSSEEPKGKEDLVLASTQTQAVSESENTAETSTLDSRAILDNLRETVKIDLAAMTEHLVSEIGRRRRS